MQLTVNRSNLPKAKFTSSTLISVLIHLIFATIFALTIRDQYIKEEGALALEWVELPSSRRVVQKPHVKRVQPRATRNRSLKPSNQPQLHVSASAQVAETAHQLPTPIRHNAEFSATAPAAITSPAATAAKAPMGPGDLVLPPSTGAAHSIQSNEGLLTGRFRAPGRVDTESRGIAAMIQSTSAVDSSDAFDVRVRVPENNLGAVLVGRGTDVQGHIRLIRLKHSLSDWWQDPTALPSFMKWLSENTRLHADMKFEGGALPITNRRILDAPIIFMTGHDKAITVGRALVKGGPLTDSFSSEERAALRTYIVERGGTLFFDDCGFNGLFAAQVADELQGIFPDYPLEDIPHDHEIYTIYYNLSGPPTGGDIFWGSENHPKMSQFRYQRGITIGPRLAVVYNRKDYMCAMETAEIESRTMLRMRRSTDVYRFMTNLLFYAMKHGGNTDRSRYKDLSQ